LRSEIPEERVSWFSVIPNCDGVVGTWIDEMPGEPDGIVVNAAGKCTTSGEF
jgi:hypothetical protein